MLDDADLTTLPEVEALRHANRALLNQYTELAESVADLEADTVDNIGWRRLYAHGQQEFTEDGLKRIATVCQLMAVKNPLIRRALGLRAAYTWGQGIEVVAADPRVDKVVQDFIADQDNQDALFGPTARVGRDVSSGTDGNLFIACYTNAEDGSVVVRTIPFTEIGRTIRNPDDRLDPWFYRHDTVIDRLGQDGQILPETHSVWHPALGDHPGRPGPGFFRDGVIDGASILWDSPVLHMVEDRPDGWMYGVPVTYAAVDWAMAHKEFLTDWALHMKALARLTWQLTGPGRKQAAARTALAAPPSIDPATGKALFAGGTAMLGMDQRLEAIPKSGATLDANSADPLLNMIAAAFGLPLTALLGDPSRGDRSAAENLDRPTELGMQLHQAWWAAGYKRLFDYVIDMSARAPQGYLRMARIERDKRGRQKVILANGRDRTVRVTFPDLDDITPAAKIDAIVKADQTGKVAPLQIGRMLLVALGHPDPDAALADLTGPGGEFQPAEGTQLALDVELQKANIAAAKAGVAAASAARPARGTTQKNTDAENPGDPDPSGADPAESPTTARNRARRAPTRKGSSDGGSQAQLPDD